MKIESYLKTTYHNHWNYFVLILFFFYFSAQLFRIFTRKFVWIPQFLEMLSTLAHFLVFQVDKRYSCGRLVDNFVAILFSFPAISHIHKLVCLNITILCNAFQNLSTLLLSKLANGIYVGVAWSLGVHSIKS